MIFFDSEAYLQTISGLAIVENTPVIKRLSGVYYYDLNSIFQVDISDLDFLASDSYPDTLVVLTGSEYGLPTLNLSGSNLTNWSDSYDAINASYQKLDWAITQVNFSTITTTGNVSAQVYDWSAGDSVNSPDNAVCIDTYTDNSTRIFEDFRSETRRLKSDLSTAWDSTQDINADDDNLGLQVAENRCLYPTRNFSAYAPSSGSQPNYTTSSGTRTLFINFYHANTSHSNGIFQFGDFTITESDITNQYFKIELSLNGTDWFNATADYAGGVLSNGDGCRVSPDTYSLSINNQIAFTFGTGKFTDGSSGLSTDGFYGVFIKISMTADINSKYIGSIEINDWI